MAQSKEQLTTQFLVQCVSRDRKGRPRVDDPMSARNAPHALRLGEKLAPEKVGVVVFSRTGNPKTGDFDDAVVLARHGTMPFDAEELAAA